MKKHAAFATEIVVLAALYVLAARAGLQIDAVGGFATLVWPPTGIALAALLIRGYRLWPGVALGAIVANVLTGASIPVAPCLRQTPQTAAPATSTPRQLAMPEFSCAAHGGGHRARRGSRFI